MQSITNSTDVQLILAYQADKNSEVFGEIYSRYNQKVFLYCYKILEDRDSAFDVTQDLFIKVSDKLTQLKEPVTFVKWIFRVAHNACMDKLRAKKHYIVSDCNVDEVLQIEADDFHEEIAKQELIGKMYKGLEQLSQLERELLIRKYYGSTTIHELVDEFGMTMSAVKMRLSRSKNKVRSYCRNAEMAVA